MMLLERDRLKVGAGMTKKAYCFSRRLWGWCSSIRIRIRMPFSFSFGILNRKRTQQHAFRFCSQRYIASPETIQINHTCWQLTIELYAREFRARQPSYCSLMYSSDTCWLQDPTGHEHGPTNSPKDLKSGQKNCTIHTTDLAFSCVK